MTAPVLHTSPVPVQAPKKREALFGLLTDLCDHDQAELFRVGGARYGARLHELRKRGHCITSTPVDATTGQWTFRLNFLLAGTHAWARGDERDVCTLCGEER